MKNMECLRCGYEFVGFIGDECPKCGANNKDVADQDELRERKDPT